MKVIIDTDTQMLQLEKEDNVEEFPLYSDEAFQILSQQWVKIGWNQKYAYTFSWLGRPIIQLPEDMIRIQEVLYTVQPDVIIETGVAHGGSLIFYASLCHAIGKGRVIGIDIEIRPHNRKAIEEHPLFTYITLLEGSSTDRDTLQAVQRQIEPNQTTFVILDSNHAKEHVLAELCAYANLVSIGSYIVVADGVMETLADTPRGEADWCWNNPKAAIEQFISENRSFVIEEPIFPFNEAERVARVTHWPSAYLKRVK